MIKITIPAFKELRLAHLVLDYNGTLAVDGILLEGVAARLEALSEKLRIHVVTADTFGKARQGLAGLPCELTILPKENQAEAKREFVEKLGAEGVVAIGNGRNDTLMLRAASLGVAVIEGECLAAQTLLAADVIAPNIHAALDLLANPLRLVATLRS
jgi:soluble P-type ATPase